ncbi:endonuclease/exonuclease/phosphatase family protein [Streptomyces sp. NPDC002514]|uniref:endonuclease/exonuclease/phosphatase family protein n=1 Tax=Streptomyces sp. NPDC001270 TaxID=3364554 RepID=UPI0036BF9442
MTTLDVLTFNLNNPGRERAERQLDYLAARPEDVLVLTETVDSAGCDLLAGAFRDAGYNVHYPRPPRGERGVMIVSRLVTTARPAAVSYLPHRCETVTVGTDQGPLDIVGLYVPSRDSTEVKTRRKQDFLSDLCWSLPSGCQELRLVLGDFNILEPDHQPHYRFFRRFEYAAYEWFAEAGYRDAFRMLHPKAQEYSWVGRTGDGYRYDHAHTSSGLATALISCTYVHEVRTAENRLTDHSALTVSLALQATAPLPVTTPATQPTGLF